MHRLFIAIDVPDDVRTQIRELYDPTLGARWTPMEQFHLTLRFIGDQDDDGLNDIRKVLEQVQVPTFDVYVDGVDVFPSPRKARVLVTRLGASAELVQLNRQIEDLLVHRCGLEPEPKPFKPHVTLARFNNPDPARIEAFLRDYANLRSRIFTVDRFFLYKSTLLRSGAVHEKVDTYPLVAHQENDRTNASR